MPENRSQKLRARGRKIICFLFSAVCLLSAVFCQAANLKIHFIDAGEGDAVLIETPGDKAVLIDAGSLITGFSVAGYLKEKGINRISRLIFTHPHLDHIGGAFFVMQMIKVDKVYDNGEDLSGLARSQDAYRWYERLVRNSGKYAVLKAGDRFSLDGVILKVLWPDHPLAFPDFNSNSLVIMIKYNGFSCLLPGDLTAGGERGLLQINGGLKADVLKVSHHGGADATSFDFLEKVSPDTAIISADKDNRRGYPSEKVLQRLRGRGVKIYRTDRQGNIAVQAGDDGSFSVETEK